MKMSFKKDFCDYNFQTIFKKKLVENNSESFNKWKHSIRENNVDLKFKLILDTAERVAIYW